jgi:hypothetical protein
VKQSCRSGQKGSINWRLPAENRKTKTVDLIEKVSRFLFEGEADRAIKPVHPDR